MNAPSILVIEDNPQTRKLFRVALEKDGYDVIAAADGADTRRLLATHAADLVLMDLHLPDIGGEALLHRVRESVGTDVPVIAVSGLMSTIEELRTLDAGFTDYLFKPVDTARLLTVVETYLRPKRSATAIGAGRRILLVDDDPVQRKLAALQLRHAGFVVETATDAGSALLHATRMLPDAIVTDLIMPDVTGFDLCVAVRRDPLLRATPVVVISSTNLTLDGDEATLAERVGADALIERSPELSELIDALGVAFSRDRDRHADDTAEDVGRAYTRRLVRRLEHQAGVTSTIKRRAATDAALLSIMTGAAQVLTREANLEFVLRDVLARALDAGGVSAGAIFLFDREEYLELRSQIGFDPEQANGLDAFFGHRITLRDLAQAEHPTLLPSSAVDTVVSRAVLQASRVASMIVAPLIVAGRSHGALVMASGSDGLGEAWLPSIGAIATHIAQAVVLSRTLDELRVSKDLYRSLFEELPVAAFRTSPSGQVLEVNREGIRLLGAQDRGDALSQGAISLYVDPADADRVRARVAQEGEVRAVELQLRRPDGAPMWAAMTARAVRDTQGAHVYNEGVIIDISERKALEAQLLQAQKMEAIGLLAGGVAHDFNNLLTVISGYSEALLSVAAANDPSREGLDEINAAARRAAALTRQLLTFSRRQLVHPRLIDVNNAIHDAEKLLRRTLGEHIELRAEYAPAVASILIDPAQIDQIVMNLAINARDAMEPGGVLTIRTSERLVERGEGAGEGLADGKYVVVSVADTGKGMDASTVSRIFEPFFTTKEVGRGTGLGLSTVYGIVTHAGGRIAVSTAPGAGSTFTIHFPASDRSAVAASAEQRPVLSTGAGSILLVEDDDGVRRLARNVLRLGGYDVVAASRPSEAIAAARSPDNRFDLLVTDAVMPEMGGLELSEVIARLVPNIRVLFMSGYAENPLLRDAVESRSAAFLAKPFAKNELLNAVHSVMSASRTS